MKNYNISYRRVGDYNIPNLILPPEEAKITLGKWGMLYKDYLLKNKKVLFNLLLIQGKLYQRRTHTIFLKAKRIWGYLQLV